MRDGRMRQVRAAQGGLVSARRGRGDPTNADASEAVRQADQCVRAYTDVGKIL